MEEEVFGTYLEERCERQVSWYNKRNSWNKQYYQSFQWTAIIISVFIPVLVASISDWKWFAITLAIATAALKIFKFEESWITYRTVAESLKKEKYYCDTEAIDYATAENKK